MSMSISYCISNCIQIVSNLDFFRLISAFSNAFLHIFQSNSSVIYLMCVSYCTTYYNVLKNNFLSISLKIVIIVYNKYYPCIIYHHCTIGIVIPTNDLYIYISNFLKIFCYLMYFHIICKIYCILYILHILVFYIQIIPICVNYLYVLFSHVINLNSLLTSYYNKKQLCSSYSKVKNYINITKLYYMLLLLYYFGVKHVVYYSIIYIIQTFFLILFPLPLNKTLSITFKILYTIRLNYLYGFWGLVINVNLLHYSKTQKNSNYLKITKYIYLCMFPIYINILIDHRGFDHIFLICLHQVETSIDYINSKIICLVLNRILLIHSLTLNITIFFCQIRTWNINSQLLYLLILFNCLIPYVILS